MRGKEGVARRAKRLQSLAPEQTDRETCPAPSWECMASSACSLFAPEEFRVSQI